MVNTEDSHILGAFKFHSLPLNHSDILITMYGLG